MCVSLFMRIGYTKDPERYAPREHLHTTRILRSARAADAIPACAVDGALPRPATGPAGLVDDVPSSRADGVPTYPTRGVPSPQRLMRLQAQQHEGEDAQYWALRRRVMQRLGTRQAHWNPHLMHKFPIFCKYNPWPVNHYKTCMFC